METLPTTIETQVLAPHGERTHHKHSISKLNYYEACEGFESKPGTSSAAEDGTRLHEIMEKVIRVVVHLKLSADRALTKVLEKETINEEEESYLRFCCAQLDTFLCRKHVAIKMEERVHLHNAAGKELTFGHYDTMILLSESVAVLFDWKFGWLPVPPAEDNLQGMGYGLGCFQKNTGLKKLGVMFVQPKLRAVTHCTYERKDSPAMLERIETLLGRVELEFADKTLRPGPYCDYCKMPGLGCRALLGEATRAVAIYDGLPMPTTFDPSLIETPEQMAKALYVIDRLDALLSAASELKAKARDMARANGGVIAAQVGDKIISFELKSKNSKRSLNSPALIADALKDYLTPEQVLAACDPKITLLEPIFAENYVAVQRAEAYALLSKAEAEASVMEARGDREGAEQKREEARVEAKTMRATKKQAVDVLNSTLEAEGLLTMPENKVEYLKARIEKQAKQVTQKTHGS